MNGWRETVEGSEKKTDSHKLISKSDSGKWLFEKNFVTRQLWVL